METLTQSALAAMIDHTLLRPEARSAEIEKLCREADEFGFASVCVNGYRVAQAKSFLRNPSVKVCSVIGFPLGAARAEVKALETVRAMADGADEIDMVMNIGAAKDANWAAVETDIGGVVKAARGAVVKVILETCLLTDSEIIKACEISKTAGASFVKTSTGFAKAGATLEHVRLMRRTVGDGFGVKASGGIKDRAQMLALIEAGANRIGTSSGVQLIRDEKSSGGY